MSLRVAARRIHNVARPSVQARVSAFRTPAFRRFSTETPPPPKKSNTALYAGVGAAALAGVAFWIFSSDSDAAKSAGTVFKSGAQSAKVAANFVPTKEDYIKVKQFSPSSSLDQPFSLSLSLTSYVSTAPSIQSQFN